MTDQYMFELKYGSPDSKMELALQQSLQRGHIPTVERDEAGNVMGMSAGGETIGINFRPYFPSSYLAVKSATTTVAGQSEAIATGARRIYCKNLDTTNTVKIGFGASNAEAETAAVTAETIALPYIEHYFAIPIGRANYAWLGVGGTVSILLGQTP